MVEITFNPGGGPTVSLEVGDYSLDVDPNEVGWFDFIANLPIFGMVNPIAAAKVAGRLKGVELAQSNSFEIDALAQALKRPAGNLNRRDSLES